MKLPILVKDGILYSSLEPLPEKEDIARVLPYNSKSFVEEAYQKALSQWRIEVEDQKAVDGALFAIGVLKIGKPIPDGLYFIEVKEAKMVEQWRGNEPFWHDRDPKIHSSLERIAQIKNYECRKVIRITP